MFAVEFHYFHDLLSHPKCQGSLSASDFERMLDYLQSKFTLMDGKKFLEAAVNGTGEENQICLTFDDGVRSQLDVAVPVLESRGLTGIFFCYSSHFTGDISMLEVYHDFRFRCYKDVDAFYREFFEILRQDPGICTLQMQHSMDRFSYDDYLVHCPWHSYTDKLFRFTRDCLLTKAQYRELMGRMMLRRGYDWKKQSEGLWMDGQSLRELEKRGHVVGLHSHTHPTNITGLGEGEQVWEYVENQRCLSQILGHPVQVAAYPCGKYQPGTLETMKQLGVQIAFTAEMNSYADPLRMPRKNHPLIWKEMCASPDCAE